MQGTITYNGLHPQRKRLYPLTERHNLKTNPELAWLGSVDTYMRPDSKNIQNNSEYGSVGYSAYLDRKLLDRYAVDQIQLLNSGTPEYKDTDKSKSIKDKISRLRVLEKQSSIGLNDSLAEEISKFQVKNQWKKQDSHKSQKRVDIRQRNASISEWDSSRQSSESSSPVSKSKNIQRNYAKYLKDFILRSAFDRPQYAKSSLASQHPYKNIKPDHLEQFLRK